MKNFTLYSLLFFLLGIVNVNAQTAWPGYNERGTTTPGACGTNVVVNNMSPGSYVRFNVVNTAEYYFNNCATANWDTDIRIYRNDNQAQLAYSDAGIGRWLIRE